MIEDYIYARGGVWPRGSIALGVIYIELGPLCVKMLLLMYNTQFLNFSNNVEEFTFLFGYDKPQSSCAAQCESTGRT